jgi:hypothetical protein
MNQKDAHDSPCNNAPEIPSEDSHLQHILAMLKNITA